MLFKTLEIEVIMEKIKQKHIGNKFRLVIILFKKKPLGLRSRRRPRRKWWEEIEENIN